MIIVTLFFLKQYYFKLQIFHSFCKIFFVHQGGNPVSIPHQVSRGSYVHSVLFLFLFSFRISSPPPKVATSSHHGTQNGHSGGGHFLEGVGQILAFGAKGQDPSAL